MIINGIVKDLDYKETLSITSKPNWPIGQMFILQT